MEIDYEPARIDYTKISTLFCEPKDGAAPIIKVCFNYAKKKHSSAPPMTNTLGETTERKYREKLPPYDQMPAYLHPLMAYNIARAVGIKAKGKGILILAAILLHDIVEDAVGSVAVLERDLITEFNAADIPDAEGLAFTLSKLVKELTNDDLASRGKRLRQVDSIDTYSKEAQVVKLVELSASVLEDFLIPPKKDPEAFIRKSRSIAYAIRNAHPELAKMAIVLCREAQRYFDTNTTGTDALAIKSRLSLPWLLKKAKKYEFVCDREIESKRVHFEQERDARHGIICIELSKKSGRVLRFNILSNPDVGHVAINSQIEGITNEIEKDPDNHVYESSPFLSRHKRYIRLMELGKPLKPESFLAICERAQAIEPAFLAQIKSESRSSGARRGY